MVELNVLIGGVIGFVSALGMEEYKRFIAEKEKSKTLKRLLVLLYEEVEQISELLSIDLKNFEMCCGSGLDNHDKLHEKERIESVIKRLKHNHIIYESQSERLLTIPSYLPNSLIRFHTRLAVNTDKMLDLLKIEDEEKLKEIINLSSIESESLKKDIKDQIDKIKS
ncbi:hypothetical protein AB4160_01605 [Shewanella sp. 10N.286.51.B8]|uniref:hypothetical protein n=1 Tax=Shewanella sp. 10N.286.51.B8 TaxID=3229708 RepID=UPI00354B2BFE